MNRPYGPWAALISTGQNPQLSIGESMSVAFRSAKVAPLSRSERRQCDS